MRLMLSLLGVLVVWSGGCNKESSPGTAPGARPITAGTTDALWAFAPSGARLAVVVADGALDPLHGGALRALADLEKEPGGAAIAARIRKEAGALPVNPLDPAALAGIGIDLAKGAALFEGTGGKVAVLPVADAKKLLARFGGTSQGGVDRLGPMMCRDVSGRYVCAENQASLELAAKKGGSSQIASWPADMRGHIEVFVSPEQLGNLPLQAPQGLRAAAVFERGAVTVRVHVTGKPTGPLDGVRGARSVLAAGLADKQPVGLVLINVATLWEQLKTKMMAEVATVPPMPGGVRVSDLIASIKGELVGHALPGRPPRGLARIGLSTDGPMKKLIGACAELAPRAPPGVTLAPKGDHCAVTVDPAAMGAPAPGIPALTLDLWVEPGALVIGLGDHAAKSDAKPGLAPFAGELLAGQWLFAAWGRGAVAGGPILAALRAQDPTGGLVEWAVHHLNELGVAFGVSDDGLHVVFRLRTLWANPDDVIAAVETALSHPAPGAPDPEKALEKVAADHPDSPFARDMQANQAGLTAVSFATLGTMAAVAIPAFTKYMARSRASEARSSMLRMSLGAGRSYAESDSAAGAPGKPAFPAPSAGPTPPLGECCRQGGKCAPDPTLWKKEPWTSLGFSMDEPHVYSYEYKVIGKPGSTDPPYGYTILAHGDLDCDGVYSTFSMHGEVDPNAPGGVNSPSTVESRDEME